MTEWYIGTMGFGYKPWRGVFYPADLSDRQQLPYYAGFFNALEMDSTFYGIPTTTVVDRWRQLTPAGFKICPKTPREITHDLRLQGADAQFEAFLHAMRVLGDRLGPIVLQFPPDFTTAETSNLTEFLKRLPDDLRFAVEMRHRSWVGEATLDLLAVHRVCWIAADYIHLPRSFWATTDFVYLRFLGRHGRYPAKNKEVDDRTADMTHWLDQVRSHLDDMPTAYAFFNDDFAGFAPASATRFSRLVGMPLLDWRLPQQGSLL